MKDHGGTNCTEKENMKIIKLASLTISLLLFTSTNVVANQDTKFIEALNAFDAAQSQRNYVNAIEFLSEDISIEITKCDKTIDKMKLDDIKNGFKIFFEKAELLNVKRDITSSEFVKSDNSYIFYSNMKERLVAYNGRYDKTTISKDITKVINVHGSYKIKWVKAVVTCK
jgi:hypothetical protein